MSNLRNEEFMKKDSPFILHLIPSVGPGSFGLGQVAMNLVREQNRLGRNAAVWSLDNEADRQWAADSFGVSIDRIRRFSPSRPNILKWSRDMERAAGQEAKDISVVHQHAIWTGMSRCTSMLHERFGIPTVVTPHGSLEKWALRKSGWKKKIAMALYESANLHNASCLYACSDQEVTSFRDFGLKNPVAVIPNGISADWLTCHGDNSAFRRQFGIPVDKRLLLFLSRITPKKGLSMLIDVMSNAKELLADWHLVIAGADEFNHQVTIENKIVVNGLESKVTFVGNLLGQIKRNSFSAAELFILPTLSENFGIVVIEALGAGIPVLTTKGAPWKVLEDQKCGWWSDVNTEALTEVLKSALSRSPEELRIMGQRGKELVAARYTWAKSAEMTIELYEWLLHRRERPDFVVLD
jgi:glycosyltransferase involved in cell wall biosynthesis